MAIGDLPSWLCGTLCPQTLAPSLPECISGHKNSKQIIWKCVKFQISSDDKSKFDWGKNKEKIEFLNRDLEAILVLLRGFFHACSPSPQFCISRGFCVSFRSVVAVCSEGCIGSWAVSAQGTVLHPCQVSCMQSTNAIFKISICRCAQFNPRTLLWCIGVG
jgi:hypothetical protein